MVNKRICMGLLAAVTSLSCLASGEDESSALWGIRAAVDLNVPGKWHYKDGSVKMYKPGFGLTLGGVCNIYLDRGFYLEPGISLFYDTYSYDGIEVADASGSGVGVKDPGLYKLGLRVPVVAGYTFNLSSDYSMSVYTGPEFSYAFAGKIRIDDDMEWISDELFGNWQRRADLSWKVGVGAPVGMFMVSVDASFGLTDLLKSDISFRENRVSLGVTYYF